MEHNPIISSQIDKLKHFAQLYKIDTLFVAGDYCRSFLLPQCDIKQIDVISAHEHQVAPLASLFASEIVQLPVHEDIHTLGIIDKKGPNEVKVVFQGKSPAAYMHNQEIEDWLREQDIDEPLLNNLYGRNYTINAMVMSLQNERIYDPLDVAAKDCEKGLLRSLLPAQLLVRYNPITVLRTIRMSIQYKLSIDEDLQDAMKTARENLISSLSENRISQELVRMLKLDAGLAIDMLKKYKIDELLLLPLVAEKAHA